MRQFQRLFLQHLRVGRAVSTELAAGVPQRNGVKVGGVGAEACGIDAAQLFSIVANVFVSCRGHKPKKSQRRADGVRTTDPGSILYFKLKNSIGMCWALTRLLGKVYGLSLLKGRHLVEAQVFPRVFKSVKVDALAVDHHV